MKALILVDIQNDLLSGGPIAVTGGDDVITVANRLMSEFEFVVATQDWHPPRHGAFASAHDGHEVGDWIALGQLNQVLQPDHCVQNTSGAELATDLDRPQVTSVVQRGTDALLDGYSAFFDSGHRLETGLMSLLESWQVVEVYIMGFTTENAVKHTAMDAIRLGFVTSVILDGCRADHSRPQAEEESLNEMHRIGVHLIESGKLQMV